MESTALERREPRSVGLAYLLWLPCIFWICGLHRFYTGRWISGLVWLFTFGLCGIGGMAPNRMPDLASLGFRAMWGGMIASCMTGAVAGLFL